MANLSRDLRLAVLPAAEAGALCACANLLLWHDHPPLWRARDTGTLVRYGLGVGAILAGLAHWTYRTGRDGGPVLAASLISGGAGAATGACYGWHAHAAGRRQARRADLARQQRQADALCDFTAALRRQQGVR